MTTKNKGKFSKWMSEIKKQKKSIAVSLLFLIFAIIVDGFAGDYVTDRTGTVVSDLILDHFGPYNLSFIFVWLIVLVIAVLVLYPLIFKTKEFPYVLKMVSLFMIIRSGFVILTHLAVPLDAIVPTFSWPFQYLNFTNDLFFSGHVGLSFLGFLIFREHHKKLSCFMLISSILLAIVVLLMHVHYSIDVLSAFFITYGIYKIGNYLFK